MTLQEPTPARMPLDAVRIARSLLCDPWVEQTVILSLDARGRCIGSRVITIGTLNNAPVHPREVFRFLVSLPSHSFIFAHNHPSGICTPSQADIDITAGLNRAAKTMGIELIDSLIFSSSPSSPDEFYSLREKGMIYE